MPLFKVVAEKPNGLVNAPSFFNPFHIKDVFDPKLPKMQYKVREWEFEAKNEKEVRKFWKDAQAQGMETVQGFTLKSVEIVGPCIHVADCVEDLCGKGPNRRCPDYKTI